MDRYRSGARRMETLEEFEERRARESQERIDAFASGAKRIAHSEGAPQPSVPEYDYYGGDTDRMASLKARIQYLNERS